MAAVSGPVTPVTVRNSAIFGVNRNGTGLLASRSPDVSKSHNSSLKGTFTTILITSRQIFHHLVNNFSILALQQCQQVPEKELSSEVHHGKSIPIELDQFQFSYIFSTVSKEY